MAVPTYPPAPQSEPFNVFQTVISQYANSPILLQLVENLQAYFDQKTNFDEFYTNIWDIDTANGEGLDIWGRILGVSRILTLSTGSYLGFAEAQPDTGENAFGQSPFYTNQTLTQNFSLTDDAYRTLLLAKAVSNVCDGSIPSYNRLLMALFPGRGNCYVTEGTDNNVTLANMQIAYAFEFSLTPVDLAILEQSGVLPKPTGVSASLALNAQSLFVPLNSSSFTTSANETFLVQT